MPDVPHNIQLLTFRRGDAAYGIEVGEVRRALRRPEILPVGVTADFVIGRIRVEGRHEVVVDPGLIFGMGSDASDGSEATRVILVQHEEQGFGFLADSVDEVVEVEASAIQPPPPFTGLDHGGLVSGLLQREDEEVLLLDLGRLLENAGGGRD